ncbi:MAG: response regulator transcription factor [Chthoniobacteraceae bacterium]
MRVLIVEDEPQLARHLATALEGAGHQTQVVHDGDDALSVALGGDFDLLLLDVNLPRRDGFDVLEEIRAAHRAVRVIMLTAMGEVNDRVRGLQLGADDYLAKPFAMAELLARVEAVGRRFPVEPLKVLHVADLSLDVETREAQRGSRHIELSAREFALLKLLMREPGRVFSRTELCERVWEREHEYDTKLVEVFIGRLRRKIDEPLATPLIHTVRHAGYTIGPPP